MATREVLLVQSRTAVCVPATAAVPNYSRPLAVVTTLFFMWGFLTCLNDILVPHLKSIFDLSYARVMLIQFAFFSAYFLFSSPVVEGCERDRLPADHGRWPAHHGFWSIPVLTCGIGCFVSAVLDRAPHSCRRNNWSSSRG